MNDGLDDGIRVRRRRRATVTVLVDLVAGLSTARSWAVLLLVGLTVTAAVLASATKAVVPFVVYGGL